MSKKTIKREGPLDTTPESVTIVALGPSNADYIGRAGCKKSFLRTDEVWVVNSAIDVFRADKAFIMDDLRRIRRRFPEWSAELKQTSVPIITSKVYPEFPTSIAFPLDEVFKCVKDDVFTTSVAYMIAYAIYKKVKDLYLFGCDFWYPGSLSKEPGAEAVTYLLGIAKERGVHFRIPQSSTLLDANMVSVDKETGEVKRPLYGYDYNPGESKENIRKGRGNELDEKAAAKAPFINPEVKINKEAEIVKPSKPDGEDTQEVSHA